jgi:hypothetical protein
MGLFEPVFHPSKDLNLHFMEIADQIRDLAVSVNIRITPYRDESLPHFSNLSQVQKLKALKVLSHQRDFLAMAESEGLKPTSPQLVWRALNKMKLLPPSDLFDKITEEDTIEVYHADGTTSFKNLTFFTFISMSLEEIYCLPWTKQLISSPRMMLFFFELTAKMRFSYYQKTFTPVFNRYLIKERMGEKRTFDIHLKWVSTIIHEGEKTAMILVNRSSFAQSPLKDG